MNMSSPLGSPSVGNDGADFARAARSKIGLAITKEGKAFSSALESSSPERKMKKKTLQQQNGAESVRIWKARNFIRENSSEQLSLGQVARAANTSANYFSEKFKEATGTNFVKYLARARYEKAMGLLCELDLRVSEIAFATGFQSLSQFNRVFKKLSGKSPTEYRASVRAKTKPHS